MGAGVGESDRGRRARSAARELARAREEAAGELPFRLRQASRAVDRLVRATLAARGQGDVSIPALDVLVNCRRPIAIVTVAERLRLTPQSVGQTVASLVRAGLLDKERDWNDRRSMLVELTDEGEAVVVAAGEAISDALDFLGDLVEPGRLGELTADLATVGLVDRPRHAWSR
ncbi:MarR family winged helix-turn-helix transcriptional regulator [Pedococcus sp.]|uniref:MarR family winged helix-turn-helix transcriptional regulator n=1 Tax=Pedococcus sp. TaxID=2860345 RepID=UPI002E167945|nr:MarR family transcriptional regulator [Pedococcus sp.]